MQNNESNAAKSSHGNSFNHDVKQRMLDLLNAKKIKNFVSEPRYNYPSKTKKQFSPDGEITLLNDKIIIYYNTTTVRHDRLKQKLWDAYGTKEHFKSKDIDIKYYVVIPDEMNSKEVKNALKEKKKLQNPEYHSSIDDIITITELIKMIDN